MPATIRNLGGGDVVGGIGDTMQIAIHDEYAEWYWCDGEKWLRAESKHDAQLLAERARAEADGFTSLRAWRAHERMRVRGWRDDKGLEPLSEADLLQMYPDED